MTTLFSNFSAGTTTDNPLTNSATTINSAGFANLPVVSSPDIMRIVLDPDASAGAPELVTITNHTASATSVTVTRGAEGTTARQHNSGTVWRAVVTKADADAWTAILAAGAIDTTNLATGAVTTAKITDANVTTAKIADANVTLAKMAANSVDSDQYVDGSIDTAHLADDVVTDAKVGAPTTGSLDSGKIRYARMGNIVHVWTTAVSSSGIVGTLPAGFRPAAQVEATPDVTILTDGRVVLDATTRFSLSFSTV